MHAFRPKDYGAVRGAILDGDVLLWRPSSIAGRLICFGTRQAYSHASMAGFDPQGRLRNVEMVQWAGGRRPYLSDQIRQFPGSCEVWRPRPIEYDGHGALVAMLWLVGQPYGWTDFARVAVRHVFPRIVLPKAVNSDCPDEPRVCSASVAWAIRVSNGIEPVPGVPDLDVSPGDLAASGFLAYQFTLFP